MSSWAKIKRIWCPISSVKIVLQETYRRKGVLESLVDSVIISWLGQYSYSYNYYLDQNLTVTGNTKKA